MIDTESWFTLGEEVRLEVVDDADVNDIDDVNREVALVFTKNKEIHQKMLQGIINTLLSHDSKYTVHVPVFTLYVMRVDRLYSTNIV